MWILFSEYKIDAEYDWLNTNNAFHITQIYISWAFKSIHTGLSGSNINFKPGQYSPAGSGIRGRTSSGCFSDVLFSADHTDIRATYGGPIRRVAGLLKIYER